MAFADDCVFALSPLFRLQWEEAQQRDVLLYPEGLVELNQSSAEILKRCDGSRTLDRIVAELEEAFSASGLKEDVAGFIEVALEHGWIKQI